MAVRERASAEVNHATIQGGSLAAVESGRVRRSQGVLPADNRSGPAGKCLTKTYSGKRELPAIERFHEHVLVEDAAEDD